MRLSIIQPSNTTPLKIRPPTELPETSLMGSAYRGELFPIKPRKTLKRYKVVQCPKCGAIRITEAKYFYCLVCYKSTVFRSRGEWRVRFNDFENFEEGRSYMQKWTEAIRKKDNKRLTKMGKLEIV